MKIYTKGKSPKLSRNELKYAAQWMSGLVMTRQLLKHIVIRIHHEPLKQIKGSTEWLDDPDSPREFLIKLDSRISKKQQLQTLAHELVHVKQYATNELKDFSVTHTKWKKILYKEGAMHYYDLPWEIEAHGREFGMYIRYLEHLDNVGKSFKPIKRKSKC